LRLKSNGELFLSTYTHPLIHPSIHPGGVHRYTSENAVETHRGTVFVFFIHPFVPEGVLSTVVEKPIETQRGMISFVSSLLAFFFHLIYSFSSFISVIISPVHIRFSVEHDEGYILAFPSCIVDYF
jgi:hypothetical protein